MDGHHYSSKRKFLKKKKTLVDRDAYELFIELPRNTHGWDS
jgi:hypothetical protein